MVKYRNKVYKKEWQAIVIACIQIAGGAAMLGVGMFGVAALLFVMGL